MLFLVSGCGNDGRDSLNPPPRGHCVSSLDCEEKLCSAAECVSGRCRYEELDNCCGNEVMDRIENGAEGNECTCPEDYGKCEGAATLTSGRRTIDASYVTKQCTEDLKCEFGVSEDDITEVKLIKEHDNGFFKIEVVPTYNQPFQVGKDLINFRITVKDVGENTIPPISFTRIVLKDKASLFGERNIQGVFDTIGISQNFDVSMLYQPSQVEELLKTLTYSLEFEFSYKQKRRNSEGETVYDVLSKRDSFETTLGTKILVVDVK